MTMMDYDDFAHIGPGTLAGRYLRRFWQPVHVSAELEIGRPVRVLSHGEHFTLYRGESGDPHMVEDACPHRATRLSLGWVEGECIRCFYHGWKFDETGQCVEQPAERESFARKVRIRSYPTREYLGLVFAYLGDGASPEFPRYPEMEYADGLYSVSRRMVPCNYFQRMENDLDEVHVHFVHKVSTDAAGLNEIPEIAVTETDYGIRREGARTDTMANQSRTGHFFMPNVLLVDLPPTPENDYWTLHLAWRTAVDDETMASCIVSLRKGEGASNLESRVVADSETRRKSADPWQLTEEILAGKLRVQDLDPSYPGLFNVEDNVALAGQGRIVDRSREWLGQSDKGIILLRKLWRRELKALSDGGTLKDWKRPAEKLDMLVDGVQEIMEL